jgi:hydroxymethylglutaryl-CoA lyase
MLFRPPPSFPAHHWEACIRPTETGPQEAPAQRPVPGFVVEDETPRDGLPSDDSHNENETGIHRPDVARGAERTMNMNEFPTRITIEDETLRDGLQSDKTILSVDEKIEFIKGIEASGVRRIQVGSFVHPKWVPQMANTDEVFKKLPRNPDVLYTALVLNEKGLERAVACNVGHLSISVSASESHSKKNMNKSIADAKKDIEGMIKSARAKGIRVRAGIQSAFGCAYEGAISKDVVCEIAKLYDGLGVDEINLADSAGLGNPKSIYELVMRVRKVISKGPTISLHLHDTRGLGLANMVAGLEAGVTVYDACVGGLGGCPFIPGAAGNIASEDAVYAAQEMGVETGIDWKGLASLALKFEEKLGRTLPSVMAHLPAASCSK